MIIVGLRTAPPVEHHLARVQQVVFYRCGAPTSRMLPPVIPLVSAGGWPAFSRQPSRDTPDMPEHLPQGPDVRRLTALLEGLRYHTPLTVAANREPLLQQIPVMLHRSSGTVLGIPLAVEGFSALRDAAGATLAALPPSWGPLEIWRDNPMIVCAWESGTCEDRELTIPAAPIHPTGAFWLSAIHVHRQDEALLWGELFYRRVTTREAPVTPRQEPQ